MLYYDRIGISKVTDLSKSNDSKECMICHYCLFKYGLEFQHYICNGCHDLGILCLNTSSIAIITVDYHCIIYNIIKSEAIHLLRNSLLEDHYYMLGCTIKKSILTLFRMGFFGAAHGWRGAKSHTYPTMMKLGTVVPYLKKFQKLYESHDAPLGFC